VRRCAAIKGAALRFYDSAQATANSRYQEFIAQAVGQCQRVVRENHSLKSRMLYNAWSSLV
jgi:hypothetical protein